MKFLAITLIVHAPDPVTGVQKSTNERFREVIDNALLAEELGFDGFGVGERHERPFISSSPPVVLSHIAALTSRIRLFTAVTTLSLLDPVRAYEDYATLDHLSAGRLDLIIGKGNGTAQRELFHVTPEDQWDRNAESYELFYGEQIDDILALLRGDHRASDGTEAHAVPGEGAEVQIWILGSSGGQSADVAGRNGLRFAANYHVSPATVLEAAEGYRAAFQPSDNLDKPYVSVSADVVVAEDDATARELATGYGPWVRSIRTAEGAIPFPTPEQARAHPWTEADRALVADRVDTQFVGSPGRVADQLEQLQEATDADELIITTITHDHADRVRSYQLLAEEWRRR
ncbi:MsnO8 family LLM class oxidoreductase [Streptomyces sp. NPDC002701]|uniref:MsnO8 family LLM class oxidoreductase n=1 Tax=Streptomyces sp. NPDC002701 TaxID=3364661 RepID=UPI003696086B